MRCKTYPFAKLLQNVDFDKSLLVEPLLVPDDLDCHQDSELVVNASHNLAKTALSKNVDNLIPVCQVVTWHNGIVTALVIIPKIWLVRVQVADNFGCALCATEIHIIIVHNLATFVDVQHGDADRLVRANPLLRGSSLPERVDGPSGNLSLLAPRAHFPHLIFCSHIVLVKLGSPRIKVPHGAR